MDKLERKIINAKNDKMTYKDVINRIGQNIENVESGLTEYKLFYENVRTIISTFRGNS